jgi:hypothetical protein
MGGGGMGGGGMGGGGMGGGGMGGGGAAAPAAGSLQAVEAELRTLVADTAATSEKIVAKVKELRTVRDKAEKELDDARKALAAVVNPKQEGVLISQGYLR